MLFCNEVYGVLYGLMRVCLFSQDDVYIFCIEEQINFEIVVFIIMLREVYKDFGFDDICIKFFICLENCVGSDEIWDKVEFVL